MDEWCLDAETVPDPAASDVPLCVDLDGTLVRADLLVEGLVYLLTSRRAISALPQLLTADRALLKRRVAELADLDPATLPYNEALLGHLADEKARGRRLVLATAADAKVAHAVAEHLGIFDDVVCSDGARNLKGDRKAEALVARFGEGGFDYAGNDRDDLAVWRHARRAVLVNAPSSVSGQVRANVEVAGEFATEGSRIRAAVRALRPHQWAKNVLVFVPLIVGHAAADPVAWTGAILMFLAFCATASAVYIVNDLSDLAADRQHPRKRLRPFASGALRPQQGVLLAGALLVLGLSLAAAVQALPIILLYAMVSFGYSVELKKWPLVDVFVLGGLYTIRVLGGGVATGQFVSMWLIAFTGFLFLALALVKRTEEMTAVARSAGTRIAAGRGYYPEDTPMLIGFGCAASFASSVVLALFVGSEAALSEYRTPQVLWMIVPLLLFWQCRLWLSTNRGHMHDDPIVYASRDWVSWIVAAATLAIFAAATVGVPLEVLGIQH